MFDDRRAMDSSFIPPEPSHVMRLVTESRSGTACGATDKLLALCYDQLRVLARRFLTDEPKGHTLQPTALVHEAYLRLAQGEAVAVENRSHFLRLAARAMRSVLVDHARARRSLKRGGARAKLPLSPDQEAISTASADVLVLDEALKDLVAFKERVAAVVEMRYFGGLTVSETALALDVSERTIADDWAFARAWLARRLGEG